MTARLVVGKVPRLLRASEQLRALTTSVTANADFARRGRRLLENGEIELGPFAAVPMREFDAWESDPLRNRSWQWRLNWLSFVSYLIAHHAATGDTRAIHLALSAARSWIEHFGPPHASGGFEFAWHDHATALRAEQLALLIHYTDANGLWEEHAQSPAGMSLAMACIQHAELLHQDNFFSKYTNHGLEQARVSLLLATALAAEGDPVPMDWRNRALKRIEGEMRHAFTDEGVHVENSPGYHAFVFKALLNIARDYPAESLGPLRRWLVEVGPRALEFLARILRPDGTLPIVGDTEAIPATDSYRAIFGADASYGWFRYAWSRGRAGTVPTQLNRVYPKSGYAIFRSAWPPAESYGRVTHLVFKAGASSRYHRQQDDGHLVVWSDGEDWLIDSGMFNYDSQSPIRQYMQSREAHNVVIVNGPLSEVGRSNPRKTWTVLASSEDSVQPFMSTRNEAYSDIVLDRRVSLQGDRRFSVEDMIWLKEGSPIDVTLLWHVPGDKQVEVLSPTEVRVRSGHTRCAMRMRVRGEIPDTVAVKAGIEAGKVWSVVSTVANAFQPSQVLVFAFAGRRHANIRTEFCFENLP